MRKLKKILSVFLAVCMMAGMTTSASASSPASDGAEVQTDDGTSGSSTDDFYKIVHLDAGRKYFSVENIKSIIDTASAAGFNYLELAVGNDGLRFLLDDMSVTAGGTEYSDDAVTAAIQAANKEYYDAGEKNELTQEEMEEIISYANKKNMGIIPLLNTPGHMNAIVTAMSALGINGSYNGSDNTVDVTNEDAVAFTKALFQKYVTYFAGKGCTVFNFGADEYANDKYSTGGMGFAQLINAGQYDEFVAYINDLAAMIKDAGMTPMAFNDGIYYNQITTNSIDKDIMIAYWSSGWSGYNVASASFLANQGFKMINTNGDYYWVLGKEAQCSAEKASGFDATAFMGDSTISNPAGAMFCIWCDVPGADTADNVVIYTKDTITAFDNALGGTTGGDNEKEAVVTDEETGVSVSAVGLTSVEVSRTEADVTVEGAKDIVAYEIVPMTAAGNYTGSATVTIPVPDTWTNVRGGVLASASGEEVTGIEGTFADGKFTFEVPHFSTVVVYDFADNALEDRVITVMAGRTTTDTITGVNYAGTYVTEDPSVAAVTVTGTDAIPESITYTKADVTCNDLIGSNSNGAWRETGYYYQVGENYYPLYAMRTSTRGFLGTIYTYTWGYSVNDSVNNVVQIGDTQEEYYSTAREPDITVHEQNITPAIPASTTVTFTATADAAGKTTYVTIGNVRYTINVVAEDLSRVDPLTVEFWITNSTVTSNGSTEMDISAAQAYSESGVQISDLVPENGVRTGADNEVVYWKSTRLDYNHQQVIDGEDRTLQGTDFTYIRYWDGNWQYSNDRAGWTSVVRGDQIVAYYLQVTDVTTEITTNVVDWGQTYYEWRYTNDNRWFWDGYVENGSKYVFLDFAVVYEDGTQNPSSFPVNNTMFFHFDGCSASNPRVLGAISFTENEDYEIWKVTVQDGTSTGYRAPSYFSSTYSGEEEVVWSEEMGGTPHIDSLSYVANRSGKLVRVYVRAKVTEDSLTVHYIDETSGNNEFYNYNIAVREGTTFDRGFDRGSDRNTLVNNTVVNIRGVTQTVTADLSQMTEIGAQYRYSDYTCVRVELSPDYKEVFLYYTFSNTHTYVVDFGLGLTIPLTDIIVSGDWTDISVSEGRYGTATISSDSIVYTPESVFNGVETLHVTFSGESGGLTHQIYICPATSVYYEEGFATYSDGWTGQDMGDGTQQTATSGQSNAYQYGYDEKYADEVTGPSNGTQAKSNNYGDTASFTFTGNGIDIYANSTPDSGRLFITVTNADDQIVKVIQVETALENGNTLATAGQDVEGYNIPVASLDLGERDTYTVSISHMKTSLEDTSDTVSIDGFRVYGTLDGTRETYRTIYSADGENGPVFVELRDQVLKALEVTTEGSQYAEQIAENVMSQVYSSAETDDGSQAAALVLSPEVSGDGYGNIMSAQDLLDNGPKNELYLRAGESVVFKLGTEIGLVNVQVGLKALDENVQYSIITGENNFVVNEATLASSTDMFYKLDDSNSNDRTVTITNNSGGILSITKIKFTGVGEGAEQTSLFGALTEEDLVPALISLGFEKDPVTNVVDLIDAIGEVTLDSEEAIHAARTAYDELNADDQARVTNFDVLTAAEEQLADYQNFARVFTDVSPDDWFFYYIYDVYEKGLMTGPADGIFKPTANLVRAEFAMVLYRVDGTEAVDFESNFPDVTEDSWYALAVTWGVNHGVIHGYSNGYFGPADQIQRQQVALMMFRYAQTMGYNTDERASLDSYADCGNVDEFAQEAMEWAVAVGLISGKYDQTVLDPRGSMSRAECATILSRFTDLYQ